MLISIGKEGAWFVSLQGLGLLKRSCFILDLPNVVILFQNVSSVTELNALFQPS